MLRLTKCSSSSKLWRFKTFPWLCCFTKRMFNVQVVVHSQLSKGDMVAMCKILHSCEVLKEKMLEISKLIWIVPATPVDSASAEHRFSVQNRIKDKSFAKFSICWLFGHFDEYMHWWIWYCFLLFWCSGWALAKCKRVHKFASVNQLFSTTRI